MTSLKNGFAVIGVIAIIAVAGAGVALVMFNGNPSEQTDAANMNGVGTDGLTYEQVQAKLQHYADILNADDGKRNYLIVSGSTYFHKGDASSSVKSDCAIFVTKGSAKIVNGDLFVSATEFYTSYENYTCDYLIPYHAIVGIKTTTYVGS